MARKIDPTVTAILESYGLDPTAVLWDCHGTWCMYHRAIEKVAAKAGIAFERPAILENDAANKSVAICVTGALGDKSEWSIGEASPGNNKNAYPWAMAEKRAKDRVVLKLIGLHGLIYSEDELPDAKAPDPGEDNNALDSSALATDMIRELREFKTLNGLERWGKAGDVKSRIANLATADQERVRGDYAKQHKALKMAEGLAA